jgi:hypothetical protein
MQFNPNQYKAKRGFAAEKKILDRDWEQLQAQSWSLTILAVDNEMSTYNGVYPDGVGKARDTNRDNMKLIEAKIKAISVEKSK